MAVERTLSIIKPDAVAKNVIGEIYSRFEKAGLKIVAARMAWLSRAEAEGFYAVHRERPFFKDLVDFMMSGPVMIQVLEGDNAIAQEPRPHGRHRSEEGGGGHHPRRFRAIDRRQRRPRLRRRRDRARRDRVFLPRAGGVFADKDENRGFRCSGRHDQPARPRTARRSRTSSPSAARSRFARARCSRWMHQRFVDDFGAMTDLAKPLRERLAAEAAVEAPRVITRHDRGRRHAQVAARRRQRQRGGVGVHPGGRPRHAVHLVAGRLRARLRVLLDGQAGIQPQPHHRRDRRPAVARQSRAARRRGHGAVDRARPPADHQRRDDGHGRAAREFRQRRAGAAAHARRQRVRAVAPPRHAVDVGPGAADRPPARGMPGRARRVAARAERRAARPPRADQPQASARAI